MFFFKSLRLKTVVIALIPTTLVLVAAAVIALYAYEEVARGIVERRDSELARITAARLSEALSRSSGALQSTAADEDVRSLQPARLSAALEQPEGQLRAFDAGVVVYGSEGVALWPSLLADDPQAAKFPAPEAFDKVRTTLRPAFSNILQDPMSGEDVILVGVPILGSDNEFGGVLAGLSTLKFSPLGEMYSEVLELSAGRESFAYLVDGDGRVIYHRDSSQVGRGLMGIAPVTRATSGETGAVVTEDSTGKSVISGFAPVLGTEWGLITQEKWSNVVRPIRDYSTLLLGLLAVGGVTSGALLFFAIGRILKPIKDITRGAERIAGGDFDHTIAAKTSDEIQDLAQQFNTMAGALKESYTDLEGKVEARTRALRESEERLRTVVTGAPVVLFAVDREGVFTFSEGRGLEALGLRPGEAIRQSVFDMYRDVPEILDNVRRALAGEEVTSMVEIGGLTFEARYCPHRDDNGDVAGLIGVATDLTERRRAEEQLKASLEEKEALLNDIQQLFQKEQRRATQMGAINDFSLRASSILSVEELLPYVANLLQDTFGYHVVNIFLLEPDSDYIVLRAGAGASKGAMPPIGDRLKVGDGINGWVAERGDAVLANDVSKDPRFLFVEELRDVRAELSVPIRVGDKIVGVLDIESAELNAFDEADLVTAQTLADLLAVTIENARLFQQSRELAVLEERNRMAREIHDTLAQGFTGIVLQLEAAEQARDESPAELPAHLSQAKNLARESLQEARRSVWALLPGALEQRSLHTALREEVRRFAAGGQEKASFGLQGDRRDLPSNVQAALLRICQESLTNIRRHAEATEVRVELTYHPEAVCLRIEDNGVGFDIEAVRAAGRQSGFGLAGMEERARLLRGTLVVRSQQRKGTLVEASIPTA